MSNILESLGYSDEGSNVFIYWW